MQEDYFPAIYIKDNTIVVPTKSMTRYRLVLLTIIVVTASLTAWVTHDLLNEGEVTPNDEFFTLSIGRVPEIQAGAWELKVDGHVANSTSFTYQEILDMPSQEVRATLKCVEGPSDTADWRGVPVSHVLGLVGVRDGAVDVVFHAADGYDSSLSLEDATADDVLLCYEMNGEPLPREQGFPLKVVAPGKAGYKWVKWVVRVEVVDYDHKGYWESRGWDDDADLAAWADWVPHALLLSLAAVLGAVSAVGGLRFSRESRFWRELPEWFSRGLHLKVSWIYLGLLFTVFVYWSVATLVRREDLFYSVHGVMGLVTVMLHVVGLVTGFWLERGREAVRGAHMATNVLGYCLLIGTITLGAILI